MIVKAASVLAVCMKDGVLVEKGVGNSVCQINETIVHIFYIYIYKSYTKKKKDREQNIK